MADHMARVKKDEPASGRGVTRSRPTTVPPAKTLRSQVRTTQGYEAQAALLKPAAPAERPETTGWSAVIRSNFARLDQDDDGFISRPEANTALSDPSFQGSAAAAIAALHKYLDLLEELSDDELMDENDGLTLNDLAAYERGTLKQKIGGDLRWVEDVHGRGQTKIAEARRELFPNGVPSLAALRQGPTGDCYFLAALGSFIARDPSALTRMIRENHKGKQVTSYTVTFPGNLGSATVPPPTDGEVARYSSAGADGLWLVVMEKAYAVARSRERRPDIQEEIGEGGRIATGLSAFTAAETDTDLLSATRRTTTSRKLDAAFGRGHQADGGKRRLVTATIQNSNPYGLPAGHAYSVIGWDGTDLVIRNPWGFVSDPPKGAPRLRGQPGQDPYATGVFLMSLDDFDDVFHEVSYEE